MIVRRPHTPLRHRALRLIAVAATLVVLAARPAHAQSDSQLWLEAGVSHDVGARVTLSFDQHVRFDDGMSRLGALMPEPGVSVRAARWLRLGAGYRMQYERNNNGDLELRHRLQLAARARADLTKAIRVEYRLQFQEQYRPDAKTTRRHSLRNRVGIEYRGVRPWTPAASLELHHDLDNGDTIHLDKVWLTFGVGRALGRGEVEAYYRAELPQYDAADPTLHILGLSYHHEL
ncbi:MAG: DUF2490 domain-containing protein [Myxococcales bacterium]|nr:DUF2490 domain-containing protein [Myxococcales bacterium]